MVTVVTPPWLAQPKLDWHHSKVEPSCSATAVEVPASPALTSYFRVVRPAKLVAAAVLSPSHPPLTEVTCSPPVPWVWNALVCATVPASVCHGANAKPSVSFSKSYT